MHIEFDEKDCRKLEKGETYADHFVIIKSEYFKPEYRSAEYQLFYATSGFGCNPDSLGNAVFGADVGERYRQERYHILGVATEEAIKQWEETYGHKREEIIERAKGDHE